jgi:hypothetical protein
MERSHREPMAARLTGGAYVSDEVADVLRLYGDLVGETAWQRSACEQLQLLAERLLEGARMRLPGAAVEIANWLPSRNERSARNWFDRMESVDDALATVACSHGFSGWTAAEADGQTRADPALEGAIESLLAGDIAAVTRAVDEFPDLVARRSHYGHRATLLHYLAANGVETYRQRVPGNAPELASLLIARGADPAATAAMYGAPRTARGMLISSSHPTTAGLASELLAVLDQAR